MDDLPVNEDVVIPAAELRLSFARSSGPGGQNVNKVESKVELRWMPATSGALSEEDRAWLLNRLTKRLTQTGELVITSSRTRDQGRNREDARAKLTRMISTALERPKPRKRTRPGRRAIERRIEEKKRRGLVKRDRREESE